MTRLKLVEPNSLTGDRRAQYERFPSNLTRALLVLDDGLALALPRTANALRASSLDPSWREGVILRVAALQGSDYERFQHVGQAHQLGWTAEQIAAIEQGDYSGSLLPPGLTAVLRFADEIVSGPTVSDEAFDAVRTVLDDRQLATVIVLVGHYMTVARILGVLHVPLDDTPDGWTNEH